MIEHLVALVKTQLENQFFSGGALLVIFTALLAVLRNIPRYAWEWFQRRIITTVDISDHDQAFFWVQKWLGEHPYTTRKARLLTASTRVLPSMLKVNESPLPEGKVQRHEVVFSPAPGRHLIRFKGHFILINRIRREGENISGDIAYHETLTFQAFSRESIKELIYEARAFSFPPEDDSITILKTNYQAWKVSQRRPPRPFDSVVLDGGILEALKADILWFFASKAWYIDHGIPYQRGYLLYGPPGNGKSSVVVALASLFKRDIYLLQLGLLTDQQLAYLMSELPEHAIILIEDVDCVYEDRRTTSSSEYLTFSGFINAIDGVCASTGRVLFMTTNHPEKLDAALVRPGRIDRKFQFNNASKDLAERLFLRFFPKEQVLATHFGALVQESPAEFSMASLQEHLISHREDPHSAATKLPAAPNATRLHPKLQPPDSPREDSVS